MWTLLIFHDSQATNARLFVLCSGSQHCRPVPLLRNVGSRLLSTSGFRIEEMYCCPIILAKELAGRGFSCLYVSHSLRVHVAFHGFFLVDCGVWILIGWYRGCYIGRLVLYRLAISYIAQNLNLDHPTHITV